MSNFLRYGIVGILSCLAIGSYLNFLAERDAKMMNYLDSTQHHDYSTRP